MNAFTICVINYLFKAVRSGGFYIVAISNVYIGLQILVSEPFFAVYYMASCLHCMNFSTGISYAFYGPERDAANPGLGVFGD